jgi:DNA repair protein RadC
MSALLDTPAEVARYWRQNIPGADWFDPMKEALVVLVLKTRRRIIGHNLVALGSLDTCPVTPLFVFRPVLAVAGSSVILVHNHPSGLPNPSEADIRVTRDLIRAGQLLKIEVLDHIIIGAGDQYCSLKALGYFF